MSNLLLVDGHYLAYRSYFAYPLNLQVEGKPVNIIYGFFTLLLKAIETYKPTKLAVCFDLPGPTFRNTIYQDYKAHRPPAPDDLKSQVIILKELLKDANINISTKENYEADDVMGSLAKEAEKESHHCYLLTGDQDSYQLVSEHIEILSPKRGEPDYNIITPEKVQEKMGVSPAQVIDFKALKGDSSDNIPGVSGIGDKTAAKLINEFQSLANIFANIEKVKPERIQNKLIDEKDNALMSYELATICSDLDLEETLQNLSINIDYQKLYQIFKEYRFESLLKRYSYLFKENETVEDDIKADKAAHRDEISYSIIQDESKLKELLPKLKDGFAFDLETTSLDVHSAQIVGASFAIDEQQGYYIPMNDFLEDENIMQEMPMFTLKDDSKKSKKAKRNPFLDLLKPLLENKNILKIMHNGKYDYQVLRRYDIKVKGLDFDTMIAAFLLHPLESVSLKELTSKHFGFDMTTFESLFDSKDNIHFEQLDLEKAAEYAAYDALFTYKLYTLFKPQLTEKGFDQLFYNIECPVQIAIADMELNGVHIDLDELYVIKEQFEKDSERYQSKIFELAGKHFNVNSTQQLASVLFDDLELPVIKKTKTGRSTNSAVLEKLADKHPIIQQLTDYRTNEKLLSTYINSMPKLINASTGRVHSSFNQAVVLTGRLSSTNPNLQNIPIRTKKGLLIRKLFTSSRSDSVIVSSDYSQIELRLMAHFSEDENMIEAFKRGEDIHAATAAIMFHCPIEDVTKEQRYQAKAVNFGIIYGISAYGLSQNISIPRREAQEMIDNYFEKFPKVKSFMENTIEQAKKDGYVKTLYGRIRPLPNINSSDKKRQAFEERVSVNTILQGTAADIMKKAMIDVYEYMQQSKIDATMLVQVHDELVFDCAKKDLQVFSDNCRSIMESVEIVSVPLKVDIANANSWGEID